MYDKQGGGGGASCAIEVERGYPIYHGNCLSVTTTVYQSFPRQAKQENFSAFDVLLILLCLNTSLRALLSTPGAERDTEANADQSNSFLIYLLTRPIRITIIFAPENTRLRLIFVINFLGIFIFENDTKIDCHSIFNRD